MIYLIRHTTPLIAKGICYGQSDLDITTTFLEEAAIIKKIIPSDIEVVYSSPLQRCSKLADELFPEHTILKDDHLKELHCGKWEMQHWDEIHKDEIAPWMNDFVNVSIPGGESYVMLYERVVAVFDKINNAHPHQKVAIVTHGGVFRSILSYINSTLLIDSFNVFKINYGAVAFLEKNENRFTHQFLSNIDHPKEQHQPSYF